jgi:hypothetical protein
LRPWRANYGLDAPTPEECGLSVSSRPVRGYALYHIFDIYEVFGLYGLHGPVKQIPRFGFFRCFRRPRPGFRSEKPFKKSSTVRRAEFLNRLPSPFSGSTMPKTPAGSKTRRVEWVPITPPFARPSGPVCPAPGPGQPVHGNEAGATQPLAETGCRNGHRQAAARCRPSRRVGGVDLPMKGCAFPERRPTMGRQPVHGNEADATQVRGGPVCRNGHRVAGAESAKAPGPLTIR